MEDNTFEIKTEINTDGIEKGTKDVSKGLEKMADTIAHAGAMSVMAFLGLFKVLPSLAKVAKKGYKELARYDEEFNKSMSAIKSSSQYLKSAITATFGGLYEMFAPLIPPIIDSLAELFNKFTEIIAYINGKDTFAKAIKEQKKYAKAITETTGKLASFDKLNVIGGNNSKGNLAFTMEDVKISDEVKERYEGIKTALENIKELFKGDFSKFDGEAVGKFLTDAIVGALDLADEIVKSIDAEGLGTKLGELLSDVLSGIDIGEITVHILKIIPDVAEKAVKGVASFLQAWFDKNPWTCSMAVALALGKLISAFTGASFMAKVWGALTTKVPALTKASQFMGRLGLSIGIAWALGAITDNFQEAHIDNKWVNTLIDVLQTAVQGVIIGASLGPQGALAGLVLGITIGIALHWGEINTGLSELEDKANKAMDGVVDKFESAVQKVFKTDKFEIPTPQVPKAFGTNGTLSNALEDAFTFKSLRSEKYPFQNLNTEMTKAGNALNKLLKDTWEDTRDNILNPLYYSITGKKLPGLATGAVIPPNAPFTAVLGDNKRETEIVSPLSTMKQALAEVLGEVGGETRVVLELDGETIYDSVVKRNRKNTARTGVNYLMG